MDQRRDLTRDARGGAYDPGSFKGNVAFVTLFYDGKGEESQEAGSEARKQQAEGKIKNGSK
jgi:hypothetical protein